MFCVGVMFRVTELKIFRDQETEIVKVDQTPSGFCNEEAEMFSDVSARAEYRIYAE